MEGIPQEYVDLKIVHSTSSRIARFIAEELRVHCPGPRNRVAVIERLLENSLVHPHLPDYYRKPKDAKIMTNIVGSLRSHLQQVKGVHSSEKLAYKGALLSAIVGDGIQSRQTSGYSRVLQTHPRNLRNAVERRLNLQTSGSSLWGLPKRRQRSDGLDGETVAHVVQWWSSETRVSPRKKDVVNKWLAPKQYEQHTTHFLTETQVCVWILQSLIYAS
jgi:hypothetical protein